MNQYDDLLKLFLDTHYQYRSKLEDSQHIEDGNWFDKVDQNIVTLHIHLYIHLVYNYIQDNKSKSKSKSKRVKVRSHQYQEGKELQVPEVYSYITEYSYIYIVTEYSYRI